MNQRSFTLQLDTTLIHYQRQSMSEVCRDDILIRGRKSLKLGDNLDRTLIRLMPPAYMVRVIEKDWRPFINEAIRRGLL